MYRGYIALISVAVTRSVRFDCKFKLKISPILFLCCHIFIFICIKQVFKSMFDVASCSVFTIPLTKSFRLSPNRYSRESGICHCLWPQLLRNNLYCVRCVAKLTHLIDVSCTTLFHASKHYIRLPRLSTAVVRVSNQRARTCAASIIRLYSAHAHMARNARARARTKATSARAHANDFSVPSQKLRSI